MVYWRFVRENEVIGLKWYAVAGTGFVEFAYDTTLSVQGVGISTRARSAIMERSCAGDVTITVKWVWDMRSHQFISRTRW